MLDLKGMLKGHSFGQLYICPFWANYSSFILKNLTFIHNSLSFKCPMCTHKLYWCTRIIRSGLLLSVSESLDPLGEAPVKEPRSSRVLLFSMLWWWFAWL